MEGRKVRVGLAYALVVLVWSTTPFGIKLSNSSLSFVAAISVRAVLALIVCSLILTVLRQPLIKHRNDWSAFLAGALGMFPNMLLVYWSAQYIPSGLTAVIFGLYPFMVGVFSLLILKENIFNMRRIIAMTIAVTGLVIINISQISLGGNAVLGLVGMVASTAFFGLSSVWLKHVGGGVDPLRQTTGMLLLVAPIYVLFWFFLDGEFPVAVDDRSLVGVIYLVLAGSVLGGTLFFYVLKNCSVASVGLITFITPIIALTIGVVFDDETFTIVTVIGSLLVIFSLAIYQNIPRHAVLLYRRQALARVL
ncbi:MAG: putative blue pigment (indigoidine) exporter [Lentisphaeria bacterium]|jgi:probable blue pigment (indigoidine) exporter